MPPSPRASQPGVGESPATWEEPPSSWQAQHRTTCMARCWRSTGDGSVDELTDPGPWCHAASFRWSSSMTLTVQRPSVPPSPTAGCRPPRSPCAHRRHLRRSVILPRSPDSWWGLARSLNLRQVEQALAAGAQYAVSPGFSPAVSRECAAQGLPLIPGVVTPGEIQAAMEAGHRVVKFFPAGASGGAPMLAALSAPFPDVQFVPTGGIDESTLAAYLRAALGARCGRHVDRTAFHHR